MPPKKLPRKNKHLQGSLGEKFAVSLLSKNGYKILETNFRSRTGEIDIIAKNGETLVFVEVKARWSRKYGKPEEAVTPRKISKIKRVIDYYNLVNPNAPKKQRIDVVALEIENGKVISSKIIKVD
jgi:putative endonuclease